MNIQTDITIIGAGLTGLTLAFYLQKAGKKVAVIEKEDRVGGVIRSWKEGGFLFESGPNTGVLSSPEMMELFEDLREKCTVDTAAPESKRRWILKNGRWHALPSGLISALCTPLFTWKDKFNILGEPFRPAGENSMESVADMVVRRLGRSYLDYAVDPFISGIYAGDPHTLVTRFALPKLYHLEHHYGSFIRGTIKKQSEPKNARDQKVTREIFSVKGGLEQLILALEEAVGKEQFYTGSRMVKVASSGKGYITTFENSAGVSGSVVSEQVVSTIGAYALPDLFPFIPSERLDPVTSLRYARIVQAAVGYLNWKGPDLKAFGGLIPSLEKKKILGILFPSSIFSERAPGKGALLSVFCGGSRHPEFYEKSDEEIKDMVLGEIRATMKVSDAPDLFKIFRYSHAIAQYEASSGERSDRIAEIQRQYPGLWLAGSIRDGIGMADRVTQARKLADHLSC